MGHVSHAIAVSVFEFHKQDRQNDDNSANFASVGCGLKQHRQSNIRGYVQFYRSQADHDANPKKSTQLMDPPDRTSPKRGPGLPGLLFLELKSGTEWSSIVQQTSIHHSVLDRQVTKHD